MSKLQEAAQALLEAAKQAGADIADVRLNEGASVNMQRRLGKIEETERAETTELGLRVFVGRCSANVSASSIDPTMFKRMAEQAVAMAKVVPEDPFADIPLAPPAPDARFLELNDPVEPSADELIERAAKAEEAALAVAGITNSEGASSSWSRSIAVLATSHGFMGEYARTYHSVSATAIAGTGTDMQRDYDYVVAVHGADLGDFAKLGREAAARALARLNPKRPETAKLPLMFDRRVAGSLLRELAGAISGASIARGTSFLKEALGQAIFAKGVNIIDDPLRVRGLFSRPTDREGQPAKTMHFIEDGVLTDWVLDTRSANQLGLKTNAHAGGLSNFYMQAGAQTPAELMADIKDGIYVTETMGHGGNSLTGDYSLGAAGFMIRNGQLAEPLAEFTIAGNLKDMFLNLTPANDLLFKGGYNAPTLRIEGMTIAGG